MKLFYIINIFIIIFCLIGIRSVRAGVPHAIKLQECNFKIYNNYDKSYYYKNDKMLVFWNTQNYKACFIKKA
jgi:hypothetical protein